MLIWKYELCRSSREEFEAELGVPNVADAYNAKNGVETVHEDVAQKGTLNTQFNKPHRERDWELASAYLYNSFCLHEVCATADRNSSGLCIVLR